MATFSQLAFTLLVGSAAAFPGMGGARRGLSLLPAKSSTATSSTTASSASGFPAWHAAQAGEGKSRS